MSDLIKARKGIFIPDITVEMFRNASLEAVEELLVSGEMQDIILPSAEPERLTDDDFETIRLHLNAQKEKLCNQQRWKEAEEYQRIIDRFMAFAQPDLQPTCNNLATDTISRQDAIRLAEQGQIQGFEWQFKKLCELPSAEPRKNGKWIEIKHTFFHKCSQCSWLNDVDSGYDFCPHCGSYNGGEQE